MRSLVGCSPNAGAQPLPEAAAQRRLLAVGCPGRIGDYSTNPPTEPYVKISLIRFLGTARFHTARLPAIADNPRPLSPSALQPHLIPVALRSRGPTRHSTHPFTILGRGR